MRKDQCLEVALDELAKVGIRDVQRSFGGKHQQIKFKSNGNGVHVYTLPCTPSDVRSAANVRADIRRILRGDGVLTTVERKPPPPRTLDRTTLLERRVAALEAPRRLRATEVSTKDMLNHSTQSGAHPLTERGNDLYETPACAVEALLRVEQLPHWIWEPAAGRGAIVNVLRDRGHAVIASDLIDYSFPLHFVGDFMAQKKAPTGTELILTNPPFKFISQVRQARVGPVPACDRPRTPRPSRDRSSHQISSSTSGSRVCMYFGTGCR